MKVLGSLLFLMTVQTPLAMRQIFKIRRSKVGLEAVNYWYLFVGANLPVTLYFCKNSRLEIKNNRRLEQEYLDWVQRTGQSEMSGLEAAMVAMEGPKKKRRLINTGFNESAQNRQ